MTETVDLLAKVDARKRVTIPAQVLEKIGSQFYFEINPDEKTVRLVKAETLFDLFGVDKDRLHVKFVRERYDDVNRYGTDRANDPDNPNRNGLKDYVKYLKKELKAVQTALKKRP